MSRSSMFFRTAGIGIIVLSMTIACSSQQADITLPAPQLDKGKPLMEVLKLRKSTREFSPRTLSMQELSNLLWAGFGINRPQSGDRTAPSAMNKQEIDLYVVLPEGIFLYDAKANTLKSVVKGDLRALAGTQPFVKDAPINIIFTSDKKKAGSENWAFGAVDAAFVSENIYLYCASEGLATVVRASIDKKALSEAMKLDKSKEIVLAQTVGYPKQ